MAHYPRQSASASAAIRAYPSSPLGVRFPAAVIPNNERLSMPAKSQQAAETTAHPIWITPNANPHAPPRPPRHPKRPRTAPHAPLSPPLDNRMSLYRIEGDSAALLALNETQLPAAGFLNRIPKPVQTDDEISTSCPISPRRPSLQSYSRPTTPNPISRDRSALRSRPSLLSIEAGNSAEVRARVKSNTPFSSTSNRSFVRDRPAFLTFTTVATTPSQVSLSNPPTASTLNDESSSSITVYDSPHERESKQESPNAGKRQFWRMKSVQKSKILHPDAHENVLAGTKSGHIASTPELVTAGYLPLKSGATGRRDEKMQASSATIDEQTPPHRIGGTIRRVWRSIVGVKA